MADMKVLREVVQTMARDVLRMLAISWEDLEITQRQAILVFMFGMVTALGKDEELKPPEIEALVILVLMDGMGYPTGDAAALSVRLLSSAARNRDSAINATMHMGIEGYFPWVAHDAKGLMGILQSAIASFPEDAPSQGWLSPEWSKDLW